MNKMNTKMVGDISEYMSITELLKNGHSVLKPLGDRLPYDIAVDLKGILVRIQVKTAYYNKKYDCFNGNVRVSKTNRKKCFFVRVDTDNVDFFIYVVREFNTFYVIPSNIIKICIGTLSFTPHRKRRVDKNNTEYYKGRFDLITNFSQSDIITCPEIDDEDEEDEEL